MALNKKCRDCGSTDLYFSPSGCDWHCHKCGGFALDMTEEEIYRESLKPEKPCYECLEKTIAHLRAMLAETLIYVELDDHNDPRPAPAEKLAKEIRKACFLEKIPSEGEA